MSVKLIAENILDSSDFLSATEQEGERWGQPEAASDNEGSLRPVISGTPADFSYSGTATSDGAADNTTVVDSVLTVYGDDYFIGATVAVTDFMQDTGDYTEEDVGAGRVALTDANTVTITNLDDDEAVWVVIDKTANHFDGDFEFHVDVNCTGTTGGAAMCGVWAVANTVDDIEDIVVANGDYLALYWHNAVAAHSLKLQECNNGSLATDTSSALSTSTQYYCRIVRDESVGTYGTLYCYIYSDASHETLVDTLSVTLTEKQDFRYLYWMIAKKAGSAGQEWNGVISNLEIVSSESQTVTDFAQATGTLTSASFNYQVNTGTAFTLTVPYSTRDFAFELIASGDTGDATFKWSHDGGTTYFGRDSLNQADWLAEHTIVSGDAPTGSTNECALVQAQNGNLVLLYQSTADDDLYRIISTDGGLTWGTASLVATMNLADNVDSAVCLPSGRLLCIADDIYYSDDDGDTWTSLRSTSSNSFCVLNNGALATVASLGTVYFYLSHDGGATLSTGVTVANDANDQANPVLIQADNGAIICAYDTNEDAVGDYEIKCKISTDGGATWGSAIDVLDFGASDIVLPKLVKDLNGDIYCFATEQAADQRIVYSVSTDNGETWGAMTQVKTNAGVDLCCQDVKIVSGHIALCVYKDITNQHYKCVRRGIWETYSSNACVCAPDVEAQNLICGAEIEWYGGAGISGDDWTFEAEYDYSMENLIEDSPSRPWRSEQDNIACYIVLDMGATAKHYADGVAFFGCNVRTLSVQMNATNAWTSPSVDESVSFDFATGGVLDSNSGANEVHDAALLASHNDHELAGLYLRFTAGALSGETFEILDNVGDYILCDGDTSTAVATDTFIVYQKHISKTFTGGPYRYARISISAQNTAEGYYQLGTMVLGRAITLTDSFGIGYDRNHEYGITMLDTPGGALIPVNNFGRKRRFTLGYAASSSGRKEILALMDYIEGKNIVFILDSTDLTDCYLMKLKDVIEQTQAYNDYFSLDAEFEEVL